jgi:hypothetical protein
MSTRTTKSDYMLLFRGTEWVGRLSPEQRDEVVARWARWFEGLIDDGRCIGGHPLHDEAIVVSRKSGRVVTDGPFVETKEAIGGYFYLRVADIEEALEIARQCPGLEHGCVVEVRPVAERCTDRLAPSEREAVEQAVAATA